MRPRKPTALRVTPRCRYDGRLVKVTNMQMCSDGHSVATTFVPCSGSSVDAQVLVLTVPSEIDAAWHARIGFAAVRLECVHLAG